MAVRLDKDPENTNDTTIGRARVSLQKPHVGAVVPIAEGGQGSAAPASPSVGAPNSRRKAPAVQDPDARVGRRGRRVVPVLVASGFLAGALVAGGIGYGVADHRGQDLARTRADLNSARDQIAATKAELINADEELSAAETARDQLQADADAVAAKSDEIDQARADLRSSQRYIKQQQHALDSRGNQLDARESYLADREAALRSYDVGHPLLDSISDDGTWVVGRDIKAGTWESYDGSGCTWSTSDGRSGAGTSGYRPIHARLENGQTFTVHGCDMWDNF